jgi:hypothetical protein
VIVNLGGFAVRKVGACEIGNGFGDPKHENEMAKKPHQAWRLDVERLGRCSNRIFCRLLNF